MLKFTVNILKSGKSTLLRRVTADFLLITVNILKVWDQLSGLTSFVSFTTDSRVIVQSNRALTLAFVFEFFGG